MRRAYLGLGSNLEDRLDNLKGAVGALEESGLVTVVAVSGVYRTEPVGPPGQQEYLNAAVAVDTDLSPGDLLGLAHSIESAHGRERAERWGPRTLDIDILLYEDEELEEAELVIPHPCISERRFVLEPLVEIAPDAVLPDGRSVRALLEDLRGGGGVALDPGLVIEW